MLEGSVAGPCVLLATLSRCGKTPCRDSRDSQEEDIQPNGYQWFPGTTVDLRELLAGQLSNDPFHLQIKKRSQNLGRVQAGSFHDVINLTGSSTLSNS